MKNIAEKREALNEIHRLRNRAKAAIDARDLVELETNVAGIALASGVMLTKIRNEKVER